MSMLAPVEGIAVTTLSSGNGTWQYSLDGNKLDGYRCCDEFVALLLRSTDYIRFVPNGQNATSADFTFTANGIKPREAQETKSTRLNVERRRLVLAVKWLNIGHPRQ